MTLCDGMGWDGMGYVVLHVLCDVTCDDMTYYGSRIKWPVFLFFSMSPHTTKQIKVPFYSTTVIMGWDEMR